jgi:hypothetical protein
MLAGNPAVHFRDQVHDVRVALDHHLVGHHHRAGLGDAADVVAAQVDQHQVLGQLLGIGLEFGFQPARSSSGVRPRGRVPAIGRTMASPPCTRTSTSGEAPTTW